MPKHSNKIHRQFKIIHASYPVISYLDCRVLGWNCKLNVKCKYPIQNALTFQPYKPNKIICMLFLNSEVDREVLCFWVRRWNFELAHKMRPDQPGRPSPFAEFPIFLGTGILLFPSITLKTLKICSSSLKQACMFLRTLLCGGLLREAGIKPALVLMPHSNVD